MDRRLAVTRFITMGLAFAAGLHFGAPLAPLPRVDSNEAGWLPASTREGLEKGRRVDRRAWGQRLALQEELLRAELADVLGPDEAWPDDPAPETTEEFFESTLLPAFAQSDGSEPVTVDCASYPCLVVFAWPLVGSELDEEERFLDGIRARNKLVAAYGKDQLSWHAESQIHIDAEGRPWNAMAWSLLPEDASPRLREHTAARARMRLIETRTENGLVPDAF